MVKTKDWLGKAEKELKTAANKGQISERTVELVDELRIHQSELEMQNEELKKSQEDLSELYNQYYELYEDVPVGYFTLDKNGIIRNVNIKGTKLFHLSKNNIIGRGFGKFIPHHSENEYYSSLANAIDTFKSQELEIELKRGKTLFCGHMEIIPSHKTGYESFRIIITDITKRKKIEKELMRASDHLEEIVEEKTAEIEEAYQNLKENELKLKGTVKELKRSNEELQRFSYITSHDLQEPLRTITSFTQLLERRYKGHFDSDADEFMDYIVDAAVRMKDMIQGLLEYSRVGTQEKEFKEFNAEIALEHALKNLKISRAECNAEITNENLPVIYANESQMTRVFQNLIGNALKFSKKIFPPRIHVSATEDNLHKEWVFSVEDNGIGMEPEYTDQIFKVFKKLHTIDEYKGTGMGLAIVEKIISFHGGHIWVESELGIGSTFYFTIPLKNNKL